ncbi:THAP domain-containing protein 11-like [Saccostrea cucullata]|uniref:THAP domain-containing protein 11-like n=1 Tax=Saccostrea cuccullata TaxID=36930 RepID=UPI002ED45562
MDTQKISKYWCVVPGCTSDGRKKRNLEKYPAMEGVDFFPFPTRLKNNTIRKRWISQINRENFEPKRHHRVCSNHFVDGRPTECNPVPTLFPRNNFMRPLKERPQNAVEKRSNFTSVQPDKFQDNETLGLELFNAPPVAAEVVVTAVLEGETAPQVQSRKLPGIAAKSSVVNHDHSYMSKEKSLDRPEPVEMSTQTDLTGEDIELLRRQTTEMKAKLADKETLIRDCFLENVVKSDQSVKHYTGLPSKPILDGLFSSIEADKCKLKYWAGKKSVGEMKYEEEGNKPGPKRKLSPYEEFILTLVRLRLGIVGFVLADLFGVSKSRVSQIFTTWISYMHDVFSPLTKWQSREKNIKYMPKSFKKSFPRTCAIIDCTEFFVQRPKTPTS